MICRVNIDLMMRGGVEVITSAYSCFTRTIYFTGGTLDQVQVESEDLVG